MLGFEGCAGPVPPLIGTVIAGPTLAVHCSIRVALLHARADEYTQESPTYHHGMGKSLY